MGFFETLSELWRFEVPYSFGKAVCLMVVSAMVGASGMALFVVGSCGGISYATVLEKEPPSMIIDGDGLSQSEDARDNDIEIKLDDIDDDEFMRLENKTLMTSTEGVDDVDIDGIPPPGITVTISHDSVIVTRAPVHFEFTEQIKQPLLELISETARQMSNGTVIIDVPPPQNMTTDLLESEPEEEEEQQQEEQQEEEEDDSSNGSNNGD